MYISCPLGSHSPRRARNFMGSYSSFLYENDSRKIWEAEMAQEKKSNEDRTRVSVRIGDFHLEVEGTNGNVKSLMGDKKDLFEFISQLKKTVGEVPSSTEPAPEVSGEEEVIPPLGRPSTTSEALSALFNSDWGRKPRTLSVIMDALEANGLYYQKPVVAKVLVDLIKKKELRRIGSKGSFQYVAA